MQPSLTSQLKPFVWFFLRFSLLLALFLTPWTVVRNSYATCYRAAANTANTIFGSFGSRGSAGFLPSKKMQQDTEVVLTNLASGASSRTYCDSSSGYNPTAFLTALILATPMPWSRKWRGLLAGLVIINFYVALRTGLFVFGCFCMSGELQLFELGVLRKTFGFLAWILVFSFAGSFVIPLPIWFLICVRRGEWERLLLGGLEQNVAETKQMQHDPARTRPSRTRKSH